MAGDRLAPVPRPSSIEQYAGLWVAVIDGEVVAAEETSHRLALTLNRMDHRKRSLAVTEFVRPTSDAFIVGAGQLDPSSVRAFRWREEENLTSGQKILRPTVAVQLQANDCQTATKALIDTGAPRTIFPRGTGDLLAIDFPSSTFDAPTRIQLLGERWNAVTETVTLSFHPDGSPSWEAEVDFVMEEGLPFAILGYEGFLNQWAVSVNGYHGYVIVESVEEFHRRVPPAVLDQL